MDHGERPGDVSRGIPGLCCPDAWAVPAVQMLLIDTRDCGNVSSFIEPNHDANLVTISVSVDRSLKQRNIAFFDGRDAPNYNFHQTGIFLGGGIGETEGRRYSHR
jgi:hypothetical protein